MRSIFRAAFLSLLFVYGCATVTPPPAGPPVARVSLKGLCEQNNISWQWDSVSQTVMLQYEGNRAKALIDSPIVLISGETVELSGPLVREKEAIIVPPDFKARIIDRLKSAPAAVPVSRTVIIDAGHGGRDPGAIGRTGLREKDVVLDIAHRLESDLRQKGFKTVMIRPDDRFITLEQRTEIAAAANADMFVSIHANSCSSRGVEGIEVYYLRDLTWEEEKEPQRKKNRRILFRSLAMEQGHPALPVILADMLDDRKKEASSVLADYVVRGLSRATKTCNRGAKDAAYFVLRNTLIPAVLVEVGFLSNTHEEGLLKTHHYRQTIADGLAASITAYSVTGKER